MTEPQNVEELPQWAQDLISETRSEGAEGETLGEDFSAQLSELQAQVEAERLNAQKVIAAVSAGVPGDKAAKVAELLQATDPTEMQTEITGMMELFNTPRGSRAVDPSQGLGGSSEPAESPRDVLNGLFDEYSGGSPMRTVQL